MWISFYDLKNLIFYLWSMALSPTDIIKELKTGTYRPIYFLQGDEPYYIDEISDYIEKNAIEEAQKGFNQVLLYGKDVDMSQIILNAKRFPMMSDKQLVLIKEAQEVKDINKEVGMKALEAYVANPLNSTILVFCHKNKTLDGRKGLAKVLDKAKCLVTSKKIYDNQLPTWITDHIKSLGHSIDPKAVVMLTEAVGNDLAKVSNEIQKLLVNFDGKVQITPDHVDKYIGISKEYNVFELQKALGSKDAFKANRILKYFESDPKGNPAIPMIALLFGYFSKILLIHHSKDKSDKAIASLLKVNPFFVKDYTATARAYSLGKVISIIHYLREADQRTKGIGSASLTDAQIMKELIFKIIH